MSRRRALLARPRAWAADYVWATSRLVRAGAGDLAAKVRPGRGLAEIAPGAAAGRVAEGPGTPVVLLPGIFETWRFLAPLADRLRRTGHEVHVVEALGLNRRDVPAGAEAVRRYLEERDLRDVVLVAHSKGGLVGKAAMLSPAGHRVAGMVAVATPWRGSVWAWMFPPFTSVGRLSPTARSLRTLRRERSVDARIVSLAPAWDPHIPGRSRLAGARNVDLAAQGHFRPLGDPAVVDQILDAVAEISGETSP